MNPVWQELVNDAVALRHRLHRRPEVAWNEHETARTIRDELSRADIPWRICAGTGTVATLAMGAGGRHIALRADIDALPLVEASGVPWTSEISGCMHACGHDGHTAALFAALWWLKRHESVLPGPVSLIFQPAEEGGHGAQRMIEDGVLEGIEAIFGWHNWPAIALGQAVCPDGVVMAANATFDILVEGRGGHASQPELCRDPLLAAAAIVQSLQQIVSRRLPPQQAAVVSVTLMEAGTAYTITPDSVKIGGSIRIANTAMRDTVGALIAEIAEHTARAYGVAATAILHPRYGATVNDMQEAARYRAAFAAELGANWLDTTVPVPIMASEDFSYYLSEIPGAFALVGSGDGSIEDHPCHSPRYDFNDALIPAMARVLARLAGAPLPE